MKILLADLETAPNLAHVWGLWGQNIGINQIIDSGYTLCWAAKWHGKREIMFDSIYHSGEKKMLKGIHALLDEADAVVTYNGDKFDLPTLNKEFILSGMKPPAPYKSIDLLRTARKKFRFPSNKLDYIAKSLGLGGKVKHKGHELWIGCMNGDEKDWKVMEQYNRKDVKLLEDVYNLMLPWVYNHPNRALYDIKESPSCTNCGSTSLQRRGYSHTNVGTYPRFRCNSCGTWMRGRKMEMLKEERENILVRDNT